MPVDVSANDWLQGIGMGLQVGQARLRNREFEAKQASQAIQDRLLATQVEEQTVKLQQMNEAVKKKAAADAEWDFTTSLVANQPIEALDTVAQKLAGTNPNAQQYLKSRLTGAQAQFMGERPAIEEKKIEGLNQRAAARVASDVELKQARTAKLNEETELLKKGGKLKPSEFEANINFINKTRRDAGEPELTPREFMDMANRHMGVLPRASAAGQWFDKAHVTNLMKEKDRLRKEIDDLQTSVPPRSRGQQEQNAVSLAAKLAREAAVSVELDKIDKRLEAEARGESNTQLATPTLDQDKATVLEDARAAIQQGKPRDKVIQRLKELGITEEP